MAESDTEKMVARLNAMTRKISDMIKGKGRML